MFCAPVDSLSNSTFNDVCIISNAVDNPVIQKALVRCCGADNVFNVDDCYSYCNITTFVDAFMWDFCIGDNVDLSDPTFTTLDGNCLPTKGSGNLQSTGSGKIATTWTPANHISLLTTDGITSNGSLDFFGETVTQTATGTTTTSTSSTKGASTTPTQTSSTSPSPTTSKTSKAASGKHISSCAGLLVALMVLGLIL